MAYKQKTNEPIREAYLLWNVKFEDIEKGYYAPTELPESWKSVKVPKIVKEEYGLEPFFKKRAKYYVYGILGGGSLILDALYRSRNLQEFISGWVLAEGGTIGYIADYKHQIALRKGFKGRKIYTFADGTKILADNRESAIETYKKHHHHRTHPHHFQLWHKKE